MKLAPTANTERLKIAPQVDAITPRVINGNTACRIALNKAVSIPTSEILNSTSWPSIMSPASNNIADISAEPIKAHAYKVSGKTRATTERAKMNEVRDIRRDKGSRMAADIIS